MQLARAYTDNSRPMLRQFFGVLTVVNLKEILRRNNIRTTGNKAELIDRIITYMENNPSRKTIQVWELAWTENYDDYYFKQIHHKYKNAKNPIQRIKFKLDLQRMNQLMNSSLVENYIKLKRGFIRAKLIKQVEPNFSPKEGDIVVNTLESGYRNEGVYIIYTGEDSGPPAVFPLQGYPDDYGSIPYWLTPGTDFGYEYFARYLVDHNSYMPINFKSLRLIEHKIPELSETDIIEKHFFCRDIKIVSIFERITDGAVLKVNSSIVVSNPLQGGPAQDYQYYGGGSCGNSNYSNIKFRSGETTRWDYKYDNKYRKVIPNLNQYVIPQSIRSKLIQEINLIYDTIKNRIVYLEMYAANEASFDLASFNQGFEKVVLN